MCFKIVNEVKRDFGDFDYLPAVCSAQRHKQELRSPCGQLAGVPDAVIKRANELSGRLK